MRLLFIVGSAVNGEFLYHKTYFRENILLLTLQNLIVEITLIPPPPPRPVDASVIDPTFLLSFVIRKYSYIKYA